MIPAFKKGDEVIYTGNYICLSNELVGLHGVVLKSEVEYNAMRGEEAEILKVYFHAIADDRSVFASNCQMHKVGDPEWEV